MARTSGQSRQRFAFTSRRRLLLGKPRLGLRGRRHAGPEPAAGAPAPLAPQPEAEFPVSLLVDDGLAPEARERIVAELRRLTRFAPRPILHAKVSIRRHEPARDRPFHVKVSLDVSGKAVRAEAEARTVAEAVDAAAERLRRNLEALEERRRAGRRFRLAR